MADGSEGPRLLRLPLWPTRLLAASRLVQHDCYSAAPINLAKVQAKVHPGELR
jgi:hypothetical protein